MKKSAFLLLHLFAFVCIPLLAQHPVSPAARLPFLLQNGEVIVSLELNGEKLPVVLDTKEKGFFLYSKFARQAGLSFKYSPGYEGGRDSLLIGKARVREIKIASLSFRPGKVKIYRSGNWVESRGGEVAGVMGSSLFQKFIVHFDFDRQEILLYDPKSFEAGSLMQVEELEISRSSPLISANVFFPKGELKGEWILLSIGMGAALAVKHKMAKKYGLFASPIRKFPLYAFEWPGHLFPASLSYSASIRLLGYQFDSIPTLAAHRDKTLAQEHPFDDLLVGTEILHRFNFTLDYFNKKIYYRANSHLLDPFQANLSGILLRKDLKTGTFFIDRIYTDSPASQAGLQVGDEIISLYYQPVHDLSLDEMRKRLNKSNTWIEIQVIRDGKVYQCKFRNKRP